MNQINVNNNSQFKVKIKKKSIFEYASICILEIAIYP